MSHPRRGVLFSNTPNSAAAQLSAPRSTALAVLAPEPDFYFDPNPPPGAVRLPRHLNDSLALSSWANLYNTVWPRTPQAGIALGKSIKSLPTMLSGLIRTIAMDPTQFTTQRTTFSCHLIKGRHRVFTQLLDMKMAS